MNFPLIDLLEKIEDNLPDDIEEFTKGALMIGAIVAVQEMKEQGIITLSDVDTFTCDTYSKVAYGKL